ncbi:MAG: trypsin-like serine protease [Gammaproteobacteria bacterium]|nr:trypsin-like serine protease [Gammaproteobacteria bacterium]
MNKMIKTGIFCLISVLASNCYAVYGTDERKDIYQAQNDPFLASVLHSIVMIVGKSSISESLEKGTFTYQLNTYYQNNNSFQPALSDICTGVLVAPDLVATARHCNENLEDKVIIRGFSLTQQLTSKQMMMDFLQIPHSIDKELRTIQNVYLSGEGSGNDFVLIRINAPFPLNEKTHKYDYLPVSTQRITYDKNKLVTHLVLMGYSSDMPLKSDFGPEKQVLSNIFDEPNRFSTNLDATGGNSGGPAFIYGNPTVIGLDSGSSMMNIPDSFSHLTQFGDNDVFMPLLGDWDNNGSGQGRELLVQSANFSQAVQDYLKKYWPTSH